MKGMVKTIRTERLFTKAQRLANEGNFEEAVQVFDQALSLNPNYAGIHLHKALSLSDAGRHEDAVAAISKAIDLQPSSSVYYMFLGRIYYDARRFSDALQAFEQSVAKDERYEFARVFKGITLLAIGKTTEAYELLQGRVNDTASSFQGRLLAVCESFLNQHQNRPWFLLHDDNDEPVGPMPNVMYTMGRFLIRLKHPIDASRRVACLYCLEGDRLRSLRQFEPAIEISKKALAALPDCDAAKEQLSDIYFDAGDYKSALQWLMETTEYKEGVGNAKADDKDAFLSQALHLRLGDIYRRLGEYDKATDHFARVAKPGLRDYQPFYYLGLCNIGLGNAGEARHWFEKATQRVNPRVAERRLQDMVQVEKEGTTPP